jgi:hypothetical protein
MLGSVLVGAPGDSGNCFPFGCGYWAPDYQQLYSSADFTGPLTLTGTTFFNTIDPGGTLDGGTYTVSLSTVSYDLSTFSAIAAQGADAVTIFSGSLPALVAGGSFTLGGDGSFYYDPSEGNLLLTIVVSNLTLGEGAYLDSRDDAGGIFSRAMSGGSENIGWGLVTQFETGSAAIPEPATCALAAAGLLGLALLRRRRA